MRMCWPHARGAWSGGHRLAGERLGIALQDSNVQPPTPSHTGDFRKKLSSSGGYEIGPDGNFVADGSKPGALDIITGGAGGDHMQGLGADDAMAGLDGADGDGFQRRFLSSTIERDTRANRCLRWTKDARRGSFMHDRPLVSNELRVCPIYLNERAVASWP
jgi:hypothetical protein